MSDHNVKNNKVVWADIPVSDLDRAINFYSAVLATEVAKIEMPEVTFGVYQGTDEGNGGCLVQKEDEISRDKGILVYLNVYGRIHDAVSQVTANGGQVLEPVHSLGPHGFRAVIIDSEGNRLALHSQVDE